MHRLLRMRAGLDARAASIAIARCAADVVVVDEASMVDLALMAKLVRALRPDARLVLLGDKDQLASVEAGAVLGDVCGDVARLLALVRGASVRVITGEPVPAGARGAEPRRCATRSCCCGTAGASRADSGIARLAEAVNRGDGDAACAVLDGRRRRRRLAADDRRARRRASAWRPPPSTASRPYLERVASGAPPDGGVFGAFGALPHPVRAPGRAQRRGRRQSTGRGRARSAAASSAPRAPGTSAVRSW